MTDAPKFELLTVAQLEALPDPEWLVEDTVPSRGLVVMFAKSGLYKSFVALDLAMCVATGTPWLGKEVKKGPVVYVVGEGWHAFKRREIAWRKHHQDMDVIDIYFTNTPVQIAARTSRRAFMKAIAGVHPILVVLDTLAQCFVGRDENTQEQMTLLVDGVRELLEAGATVLVLHHPSKANQDFERGSSVLRAAADTMMKLKANGVLTLSCEKQKDEERFRDVTLRADRVPIGTNARGNEVSSLVLVPTSEPPRREANMNPLQAVALSVLAHQPGGHIQLRDWFASTVAVWKGRSFKRRTFDRYAKQLYDNGFVARLGGGVYKLTEKGAATAKGLPMAAEGECSEAAMPASPPLGLADRQEAA